MSNAQSPFLRSRVTSFAQYFAQCDTTSVKYKGTKNKTDHLYFPCVTGENGVRMPIMASIAVHEWEDAQGKFQTALCTKDSLGSCPFCDRVQDAWGIYNHRIELAKTALQTAGKDEATIQYIIEGAADKKTNENAYRGLTNKYNDQRKMKDAKRYLYILVALFETDAQGINPVCEQGVPKYELKMWKISQKKSEDLQKMFIQDGGELGGREIMISYGNHEDIKKLIGQATITPVFPQNMFTTKFQGLTNKIDDEAAKFNFDNLNTTFPELTELEPAAAAAKANAGFVKWDQYQAEKNAGNVNARYEEYPDLPSASEVPQIGLANGAAANMPQLGVPGMGAIPQQPAQQAFQQAPGQTFNPAAAQSAPAFNPAGAPGFNPAAAQFGAPAGAPGAVPTGAPAAAQFGAPAFNGNVK